MKIGLVLEGGGMRGLYTAGVLDGLTDAHWLPDYVVGVSAGADNAASYLSGQRGRNFRINTDYLKDKRYLSVHNFLRTKSLFGMDFIFHEIPNKLDPFDYKAFASCPCAFEVGVTEVETGKTAFLGREPMEKGDFSALRASSSIPVFSPIVEIDGKKYLDGGTSDPIPVRRALEWGCDRVVVVLTRERGYRKKPEGFPAGLPAGISGIPPYDPYAGYPPPGIQPDLGSVGRMGAPGKSAGYRAGRTAGNWPV